MLVHWKVIQAFMSLVPTIQNMHNDRERHCESTRVQESEYNRTKRPACFAMDVVESTFKDRLLEPVSSTLPMAIRTPGIKTKVRQV